MKKKNGSCYKRVDKAIADDENKKGRERENWPEASMPIFGDVRAENWLALMDTWSISSQAFFSLLSTKP
jgi:hypothetical protein